MLHRLAVLTTMLFLAVGVGTVHAQGTATLSGEVKDTYGSVIPAADIIATNNATGAEVTSSTDAVGNYRLTLEPGNLHGDGGGLRLRGSHRQRRRGDDRPIGRARLHTGTGGGHHLDRGGGQPCRASVGDRVHRAGGRHSYRGLHQPGEPRPGDPASDGGSLVQHQHPADQRRGHRGPTGQPAEPGSRPHADPGQRKAPPSRGRHHLAGKRHCRRLTGARHFHHSLP